MGQTKKRNYDRYTLTFKAQAVKLAKHPDVKLKDVAESLGIHPVMLYRWQMEHRNCKPPQKIIEILSNPYLYMALPHMALPRLPQSFGFSSPPANILYIYTVY